MHFCFSKLLAVAAMSVSCARLSWEVPFQERLFLDHFHSLRRDHLAQDEEFSVPSPSLKWPCVPINGKGDPMHKIGFGAAQVDSSGSNLRGQGCSACWHGTG